MVSRFRSPVLILVLLIILFSFLAVPAVSVSASPSFSTSQCELAVLAKPIDPYYVLAEEIAAAENAPLLHNLQDVIACQPVYLLWVVSPAFLSDAVMIEFGQTLKAQPSAISTGIISASTLDGARDLWQRRAQVRGEHFFAVNAANPSALIHAGRIIAFDQEMVSTSPLTKAGFGDVLRKADYLTFTGHGASRYLRFDDETTIAAADLPALDALVIGTGSCQTVRPWREASIALAFVDQGAAAYTGFVFSPNEGYLIGEFDGLPFRYTWPDFPIGHVIQAQNHGTLQGFAHFPFQFLLGDPRIALQTGPPYRLVADRQENDWRILEFQDVPAGVIPILIPSGAAYSFVEAAGITAASMSDPFYNSRLQMTDMRNDKLILLVHQGGNFTLKLRPQAPWYWFPVDILFDSLDHTLIFIQQSGGDVLGLIVSIIPLLWIGWQVFKRRLSWPKVRLALLFGLGALLLQAGYVFARLDHVTIISKAVTFSPLSLVAAFVLSACGSLIYFQARSWPGKIIALLVITSVSWMAMLFGLGMVLAFNLLVMIPETVVPLYNYSLGLLPVASVFLTLALSGLALRYLEQRSLPS